MVQGGKAWIPTPPWGRLSFISQPLPFPVEADVRSYVNGEKRQDSNTRLFLADIPKIIEDLSKGDDS